MTSITSPKSNLAAGDKSDENKTKMNPPFLLPQTPQTSPEQSRNFPTETLPPRNGNNRRRRRRLNREKKKSSNGLSNTECFVTVRPREGSDRRICMDLGEVKACCDLGLEIPRDFTVELPGGLESPVSGAGEEAREIKEKIRAWAQTVAFVSSATRAGL